MLSPNSQKAFNSTLTTMLHTAKMLGMAAAIYFTTSFGFYSILAYPLILFPIVLQAYRDNKNLLSSILIGFTWLFEIVLRHDVRAQLTTHLDKSFKIMDMLVLVVILSHSELGFSVGETCKKRWKLFMCRCDQNSKTFGRWMDAARCIPFLRIVVPFCGPLLHGAIEDYRLDRKAGLAPDWEYTSSLDDILNDLYSTRRGWKGTTKPQTNDKINTSQYSTSPALTQVQLYTGLGSRQRLKLAAKSTIFHLPTEGLAQSSRALHMISLFTYGRLLSCLPQMSCMKLRILIAGSLLFANEFEMAFNYGAYVDRENRFRYFCFGSLASSFCIVAALMMPYSSIGLGIGMPFIPCSTFVVAMWTCLTERRKYLAGDHYGVARRLGAMVFAALFAFYLKVLDTTSKNDDLGVHGLDPRMLTGFRPGA